MLSFLNIFIVLGLLGLRYHGNPVDADFQEPSCRLESKNKFNEKFPWLLQKIKKFRFFEEVRNVSNALITAVIEIPTQIAHHSSS